MNNSQYTDSTAEYLYQKGEYINTIFWFVHEQAVYEEAWKNHWVAPRTIAFCYDTRAIMQNGNVYGVLDIDTFLRLLKQAFGDQIIVDFNNRTAQLAKAGYDKYGVIKISEAHKDVLKIDNGVLDIDLSKWNPDDGVDLEAWLIKQIKNNPKLRAKPGEYGVVKAGTGISVDDNGVISISNNGLPIASYTQLGLVQIALNGGILVDGNGVISVDWSKNPGGGNGNNGGNGNDGGDGTSGNSDDNITPLLFEGTKIATFKINGISGSLYAPNGNSSGGTGESGEGGNTYQNYLDEWIHNFIENTYSSDIKDIYSKITSFEALQALWSVLDINAAVELLVAKLNSHAWEQIWHYSTWNNDRYIQEVGLITLRSLNDTLLSTNATWSDIMLTWNEIKTTVNGITLVTDPDTGLEMNMTVLRSIIDLYIA